MSTSETSESSSPFLFVADAQLRAIGWALVTAPISTRGHHSELADLTRAGYRFAGMPGYMSFPQADGRDVRNYGALCEAWCNCFREPDRYLPDGAPRALISHSDFTDPHDVLPQRFRSWPVTEPDYDFLYVGATDPWKQEAKNWRLAARTIPKICEELGLRALVVGGPQSDFQTSAHVHFTAPFPWVEFLARIARARFLFVPNVLDASPRTIAEALCLDVPIVVNQSILGGWKYVNAFTGTFFRDEDDAVGAVRQCLGRARSPRRWYRANFGPYLAGERLLGLLRRVDSRIAERSHLVVTGRIHGSSAPLLQR